MKKDHINIKDTFAKKISNQIQKDLRNNLIRNYWFDTSRIATKKEVIIAFAVTAAVILAWIIGALYSKIIMGVIYAILLILAIYKYYLLSKNKKNK